jgi:uncharacterized membrane protein YbhN (UPF0104 family)
MKKIISLLLVMLVLSYLGQAFSGELYNFKGNSLTDSLKLIKDNLGFVIISNILFYLFEMWRLSIIGKAFNMNFTFKECFGAISLNILFAWITPAAILGAPALAYFLYRKGYPLAESITVAFVRSFSIILISALTTIFIYSMGMQGKIDNPVLQEKVFQVLTFFAVYIFGLVAVSYMPFKFVKKIKFLDKITTQIRAFLSNGMHLIIPILGLGLILNFLLVSFIMYAGLKYYSDVGLLISQSMLFLSYMLLMPTPGASGLAEIGAPMFFGHEISVTDIVSIVTAMRISVIGIQVTVGIIFMFYFFKRDLSFSELKDFNKPKIET